MFLLSTIAGALAGEPVAALTTTEPRVQTETVDLFDAWLAAPIPVADGFDLPVSGWDSCGDGCWTRAKAGAVRAVADGVVVEVSDTGLVTEHLWYDDQVRRTGTLRWRGVTPTVAIGAPVKRGQPVGTAARFAIEGDVGPVEPFLLGRPRLPVPQEERVLALVSHDLDQLRLYVDGKVVGTYEVGFGQAEGDKERRGDNRTPKGVYHVVYRSKGPFDGDYGAYYGGHWIKLGYPNPWDAARGVDAGLFDVALQREITRAFWERRMPAQGTKLGGGIGLHGWAYEWADEQPRGMSWGCVVLHLRDIPTIYEHLREGAMVALF